MGRSLQEVIKDLPAKRREGVRRSQQLIAEVMSLREHARQ